MILRALGARSAILAVLPALLVCVALWPVARPAAGAGDTFQFWYAGHLAVTGASPYDQAAWHAAGATYGPVAENVARNCDDPDSVVCVWAYPPLTAWLFAPFGALPVAAGLLAVDTFVLATVLAGAVAVVLLFGPRAPGPRALVLATAAAGHPFVIDIRAGHFVGLLLLTLVAIAWGLRERRTWPIAAGAIGLALKPHIAIGLGVAVAAVLAARGAWRTIGSIVAAIAVVGGLALLRSPEAIGAILSRGGAKAGIAWATTFAFADSTGAPATVLAVIGLVALGASAAAIRWARPDGRQVTIVAVAAALSLVVTPYAQPYDFLFALPAFAAAAAAASELRPPARTALLAAIPVLWIGGTWGPIVFGQVVRGAAQSYATVPLTALVTLALARWAARPAPGSATSAVTPP